MTDYLDLDFSNINFVKTGDGSSGLYNSIVEDIYHSSYGAKKEAIDKFINPLNFEINFKNQKNIKVLDICYGVGYNTKALLKKIIDCNYKGNVEIDALEYDKKLVLLSPFIIDGYFKEYPQISYLLTKELLPDIIESKKMLIDILENRRKKCFITPFYKQLIKKYRNWGYSYNILKKNNSFLHNIYYHCVSSRIKNTQKPFKSCNFILNTYYDDARNTILKLKPTYDIVFLDAFTPTKLPTLWSINFLKQVFNLISDNGLLVTYSNSCAVRHAMIDAGFHVGKIYDSKNRASGTIASRNEKLIKFPLDKYDLGLMETNAGIYFKDPDLNLSAKEIINNWNLEKKLLNLPSSSQYIKKHKKECSHV